MQLSSVRIVLVATSHPGNIGSSARAMKTMGIQQLYLVTPQVFPDLKATEMAAGADDILDNCVITSSLDEALQGCHLIIATSARPRGLALPGLLPRECAALVNQQADETQVAIVFGREHAGLTNEELLRCHYHVNIPSNPEYSSLNLSQAVQIMAYEIRMQHLQPQAHVASQQEELATNDQIEQFYEHLWNTLLTIKFLKPDNPGRVKQRLRRLFNRVGLELMEVNMLRGILTQMQRIKPS